MLTGLYIQLKSHPLFFRWIICGCIYICFLQTGFSQDNSNKNSPSQASYEYPKHLIKWTPGMLARGICALQYEHNICRRFSLEGGLGFCFDEDYMYKKILEANDNATYDAIYDVYLHSHFKQASPFFSIGTKFLFSDPSRGNPFYFEVAYRHCIYNMNYVPAIGPNVSYSGTTSFPYVQNQLLFNFGYQILTKGKHLKTSHEFFVGLGLRTTSYYSVLITSPSPFNSAEMRAQRSAGKKTLWDTMFNIGYTFGISVGHKK